MKDVIINIKGTQSNDTDSDVIEFTTLGKFGERDGKYMVVYEENQTLEGSLIKTTLKTEDNRIVMNRSGAIDSKLVIEKGRRNRCFYSIPQGELVLGIFGESITNKLNKNGGELSMCYTIDIDNGFLSRNTVEISIKEVENSVTNSKYC
ncbi:MAG: DUF1934 domain-containing protein [Ruminococcaceae bacterium]|nr:DUF1934 domain-containing protein [Oscillospiraceae bacterium]